MVATRVLARETLTSYEHYLEQTAGLPVSDETRSRVLKATSVGSGGAQPRPGKDLVENNALSAACLAETSELLAPLFRRVTALEDELARVRELVSADLDLEELEES